MKILFIRHGKSIDDVNGVSQRDDSPLSESGILQAKKRAFDFNSTIVDACYASHYQRAQDTAHILFPSTPIITRSDIYEIKRPTRLDGGDHKDAVHFWEVEHRLDKYAPDWSYDGSESFTEVTARARDFIDEMEEKHRTDETSIAVISHGGFIRHCIGVATMGNAYRPADFFDLLFPMRIDNLDAISLSYEEDKKPSWKILNRSDLL
ncbi:histidine phosphatase family protein [Candidatus Saccharibacteria bacterium]|nr:histidine phosphatase family protein [Candidatus Saccharibacteria bacterium]MBH2007620.1 histidine phosphatase family protein [Candidatus Saccharibacteria bacterium]